MKILIYIFLLLLLFQVFRVESIPMSSELLRQIRAENISSNDAEIVWESYDTSTILLFLLLQALHTENNEGPVTVWQSHDTPVENITYSDIEEEVY